MGKFQFALFLFATHSNYLKYTLNTLLEYFQRKFEHSGTSFWAVCLIKKP